MKESKIVALAANRLYEMGPDLSRASTPSSASAVAASAQLHGSLIRPGDQAFFDIIQSFIGYCTC